MRELAAIMPGAQARELAERYGKDPRHVQAVLDESAELVRAERGVLIVRTRHGLVCANAGVDESNAAAGTLILLPRDPDRSARALRARLRELSGQAPAVLISDSFGRAWRLGQLDTAIGCAGLQLLDDWRGRYDRRGRELHSERHRRRRCDHSRRRSRARKGLGRAGRDRQRPRRAHPPDDGPGAVALIRPMAEDLFAGEALHLAACCDAPTARARLEPGNLLARHARRARGDRRAVHDHAAHRLTAPPTPSSSSSTRRARCRCC